MEYTKPGIKSIILHTVLFTVTLGMFFFILFFVLKESRSAKKIYFNDHWNIEFRDMVYTDVSLDETVFGMADYGEKIVLTSKIPDNIFPRSAMCIKVEYSATAVYIDGEKVYEYGFDRLEQGKILGYAKQIISLPDDCAGKDIRIVLYVGENEEVASFFSPIIYNEKTLFSDFLGGDGINFALSITLLIAGLFISLITFALFFRSYNMERLLCIGIFALCIGCWSLASGSFTIFFTSSIPIKIYLEYAGLYLSPIPILLYFREDVDRRKRGAVTFVFYALLLIGLQLLVISSLCQFMNWYHFPSFLKVYQAYMFLCCIYILYLVIGDLFRENQYRIIFIGMTLMLLIVIRDLFVFNITKYGWFGVTDGSYVSFIPLGGFLFILSLLVDYIYRVRNQMIIGAENEFLSKIAYLDVLTGLYTRRKCEEIFKELDEGDSEYAIIQFDLNNLKRTNDSMGHEKGDELLIRFAKCLKLTYSASKEVVGRMGGDEFIVIIRNAKRYNVEESFQRLEKNIAADNAKNGKDMEVSSSYGYCRSTEIDEPTARVVYIEADKRMYLAKQKYYRERGGGRRRGDK